MAQAEEVTLVALGDSLTQGYGLAEEAGFVPQLEAWLEENGAEVSVVNAGVSGDTTAGGLARAEWSLTPEIEGMIVALGGNDLLRGVDPEVSRANLRGILEVAEDQEVPVLLVGLEASGNYGQDYKVAFDAMYAELADEFDALLAPDFLAGIRGEAKDSSAMRRFMQGDGIHPNAEGVARIVDELGPDVLKLVERIEAAGRSD
ncbi:MAG: arylesterase [Paracoccaceae bacterium]